MRCRPAGSCRTCSAAARRRCGRTRRRAIPVLLFSHGYGGSPISNDYIYALTVFASFGYVVAAPFHTDATFSDLQLDNVSDVIYLLTHLQNFLAMQALRPLALSASIDLAAGATAMARPRRRRADRRLRREHGRRVDDADGGCRSHDVGRACRGRRSRTTRGSRRRSATCPYFGQPIFPSFGRDQHGLDGVNLSVSRDRRHGRHDGADRGDGAGHGAPRRAARARRAHRRQARVRRRVDQRHLHVVGDLSRRRGSRQSDGARQARSR